MKTQQRKQLLEKLEKIRQKKEEIKKNATLLQKFILKKLGDHKEPSRKGTPKGKPIGFSSVKYKANLFMLYKKPLKTLADDLKVSYKLLRKWRTEPAFKELYHLHLIEFSLIFIKRIKERVKTGLKLYEDFVKNTPLDKLTELEPPFPRSYNEFDDGGLYSFPLLLCIVKMLELEAKKEDFAFYAEAYLIIRRLEILRQANIEPTKTGFVIKSKAPTDKKALAIDEKEKIRLSLERRLAKSIIEHTIEVLKKPRISELKKKETISALNLIKRTLDTKEKEEKKQIKELMERGIREKELIERGEDKI
ncbi:MAG: hypothetical protein ACOYWZ_13280 [Bacillota bacterium]